MGFILAYALEGKLYLNITNQCTNQCSFCIRNNNKGVGYDLWLDREPTAQEVIAAIGDASAYKEVVFCGFGEPLLRPEVVEEVSRYLKSKYQLIIRINTNGLSEKALGRKFLHNIKGLVDIISISLNASNSESYYDICKPSIGMEAFDALLEFAKESKNYIPKVILSVVDVAGVDIEACQKIASDIGVELRVREKLVE
jgi:TatD family-associated radical SAM protein